MAKVLLIEPDAHLASIYSAALSDAGHEVQLAAHAQDAVHVADAKQPVVVVLEVQLAGHNGIEFLYEFRSYPEWQGVPIVLLTMVPSGVLQLSSKHTEQFGIAACLYKPETNLKKLVNAVDGLL